jgi:hypothetical protein
LNDKTIKQIVQLGVGGVVALASLYLVGFILTGGFKDLAAGQASAQVEHHAMQEDLNDIGREEIKQTTLLQKICVRQSASRQEANDCLLFEP